MVDTVPRCTPPERWHAGVSARDEVNLRAGYGLSKAHIHSEVLASHGNARTTARGRLFTVERHRARRPQSHTDEATDISRKCVRKWIEQKVNPDCVIGRFGHAPAGNDRPGRRTPHHQAATPRTLRLDWIAAELCVAASTVSGVLARDGVLHVYTLDLITREVLCASKATVVRSERERLDELVHLEVEKIGRRPDCGG